MQYDDYLREARTTKDQLLMEQLSRIDSVFIREALARNPALSEVVLTRLANDPDPYVKGSAKDAIRNREFLSQS